MAKQTKEHASLLRRFHAVCTEKGVDTENKMQIVNSYGHISSKEFTVAELKEVIAKLDPPTANAPKLYGGATSDQWRKRVMAAVGGWLKKTGQESNGDKIKAIACRAAGYRDFNSIPSARLSNIYNEFRNKNTDAERVKEVKAEEINRLENNN